MRKDMETLGYIEVTGLSTALVVADKMLKTAAVELSALENTKGGGWITVVIKGDVAAVSVAIEIGKEAVGDAFVSSAVLANPAPGIDGLSQGDLFTTPQPDPDPDPTPAAPVTDAAEPSVTSAAPQVEVIQPKPVVHQADDVAVKKPQATCNLCGDPACPRKLGEPRKKCIHYRELFNQDHKK